MNNTLRILTLVLASSLSACAYQRAAPTSGSNKSDYATAGAVIGGPAGYIVCMVGGGSDETCRKLAAVGGHKAGFAGYKFGEAIDIRVANQYAETISNETGLKPVVQSRTVRSRTNHGDVEVLVMMEVVVDREDLVNEGGKLSAKASQILVKLDKLAVDTGADFAILIPVKELLLKPAIEDAAENAVFYKHHGHELVARLKPRDV